MEFSLTNIAAIGLGSWGGYAFNDMSLLVGKYEWCTKDRITVIAGILGVIMLLAPGYAKKKGGLKGVPTAVFYALACYLLGTAVYFYRS